nr:DNA mismatch repair protein MutS [Planctopirus hydrillae]
MMPADDYSPDASIPDAVMGEHIASPADVSPVETSPADPPFSVDRAGLTPMMQRYLEVKDQHPAAILFFRMGDFYELFYEDAKVAARILGLTLTSRDKNSENPVPMAGFPYHALTGYLQKMIRAGHRVAICEQVEDPKAAKGMVKREVTQIVTPGTLTDDSLLDPRETNLLAAILPGKSHSGLAWLELSTGRFICATLPATQIHDELARLQPAEVLTPERSREDLTIARIRLGAWAVTERPPWAYRPEEAHRLLLDQFGVATLEGFGFSGDNSSTTQTTIEPGIIAAGALLEYVRETQKSQLIHLSRLEPYEPSQHLLIDESTRRSLELTRTLRSNQREGSLLWAIDQTVTPMGARLLLDWLSNPLKERSAIEARLNAVSELVVDLRTTQSLQEILKTGYDIQRLTARIGTGRATPRDLVSLTRTLGLLPQIKARLAGRRSTLLNELEAKIDFHQDLREAIEAALVDEPPLNLTEGGAIRPGFDAQLDEWRDLARGGKEWMAAYQAEEVRRTGIANLKVGFNRVFGFYLECSASQADKVPPEYIRKQTLKNYERYITPALKEYEDKVLQAESRSIALEQQLFSDLRQKVSSRAAELRVTAESLAVLDVLCSFAILATRRQYVRPEIASEPVLEIRQGRHPVLDQLLPTGGFVPNDIRLGGSNGFIQLITGPNMAGKSTYIRQAALLTILTQIGSFVPAESARIGLADRIFARVGASDELGRGQSTFMVEMTETARILHSATASSLVILDEIGRGTSTYDGISLAWAITEFLHDAVGCRTFFATHYHELTQLSASLKSVMNWNVAVREQNDDVVFMHQIVPGAADKSYGIHVGRLAGLPGVVLDRAREILKVLEAEQTDHLSQDPGKSRLPARKTRRSREQQLTLFELAEHPILEKIRQLDVHGMSPEAAWQELARLRSELSP